MATLAAKTAENQPKLKLKSKSITKSSLPQPKNKRAYTRRKPVSIYKLFFFSPILIYQQQTIKIRLNLLIKLMKEYLVNQAQP